MVREYLQGNKQGKDDATLPNFTSIGEHHTCYCWRDKSQSNELPDMTSSYEYKEVG